MIYIITFLFSCSFFWLSEKTKSNIARFIFASIGILIPCILAGLRADTIGTDVRVYVEPMFDAAKQSKSISMYMSQKWYVIWRYMYVNKFEIGFSMLIYLIVKLGGSLSTILFFIQMIIISPIYFGLTKIKKTYPIWFGMLVFYLMFFNASLNMMRQWMAMSILFYGFSFLLINDKKKYFLLTFIATLFHTSAIFGIIIFFVYIYSTKARKYLKIFNVHFKHSKAPLTIFILGCVALLSLNIIVIVLNAIGLSKYVVYIRGTDGLHLLPLQILVRLPILLLLIIRWKKIVKEDKVAPFYGSMLVLDLLASQLISINAYAFRIGVFFSEYNILIYPALIYAGNKKYKINRTITLICVLVYMFIYWTYYYVIVCTHATFPYVFA